VNLSSARLFGTDGVRGTPGEFPLDKRTLARLGASIARTCRRPDGSLRVLIGRDTRESGEWITGQLARGLATEAASITNGGLLSTPAIAFLTRDGGFDAGIVVSASHNPFQDNGVKVITGSGEKADDGLETRIAALVADQTWVVPDSPVPSPKTVACGEPYIVHTSRLFDGVQAPADLGIAVDCAHGATSQIAPAVLRRLGMDPIVLHDAPDGRNINLDCGSTHPERLARAVVERGCRLGAAFDGDGDRVVFVDHRGAVVNGDAVLLIGARWLAAEGRLPQRAVVATVMSNIGLEHALRADGITVHRCSVGDRLVWAEMTRRGLALGGEQSGHIIFADHLATGDGLATALIVARAVIETGRDLADLAADLVPLPQVLVNVRVRRRTALAELPEVSQLIERAERDLEGEGRVLVRYSGTEPLVRIMVEGPDQAAIEGLAETIEQRVRAELG
jgi:phosphoglucosamine mutase|tara:strand:+ start:393 stop:1742 length:1350 start_codon:yes stop_codon:yes gene_type:complete